MERGEFFQTLRDALTCSHLFRAGGPSGPLDRERCQYDIRAAPLVNLPVAIVVEVVEADLRPGHNLTSARAKSGARGVADLDSGVAHSDVQCAEWSRVAQHLAVWGADLAAAIVVDDAVAVVVFSVTANFSDREVHLRARHGAG